jgi:hypothetical protein
MAVSLTSAAAVTAQACDANAGDVLKVTLPTGTRYVSLYPRAAAGKLTYTGTDSAAIGADYITLEADKWTVVELIRAYGSPPVIYLAHVNAAGVIEVALGRVATAD